MKEWKKHLFFIHIKSRAFFFGIVFIICYHTEVLKTMTQDDSSALISTKAMSRGNGVSIQYPMFLALTMVCALWTEGMKIITRSLGVWAATGLYKTPLDEQKNKGALWPSLSSCQVPWWWPLQRWCLQRILGNTSGRVSFNTYNLLIYKSKLASKF